MSTGTEPLADVSFTREQIDAMRSKLAKRWGQTVDQVTEDEARYFLRNKDAVPCSPKVKQMVDALNRGKP